MKLEDTGEHIIQFKKNITFVAIYKQSHEPESTTRL